MKKANPKIARPTFLMIFLFVEIIYNFFLLYSVSPSLFYLVDDFQILEFFFFFFFFFIYYVVTLVAEALPTRLEF